MAQDLDTFGVPEYFSTHLGAIEDAGCGMIRIIRCNLRNGVLVPVVMNVIPALMVLHADNQLRNLAQKIIFGDASIMTATASVMAH